MAPTLEGMTGKNGLEENVNKPVIGAAALAQPAKFFPLQTIRPMIKNFFPSWAGCAMKKKDLEYFKKLLTQRLQTLLAEASDTVSGMTGEKATFPDPTDRATMEADRNFMLRIRDRERKLIKKIREALDRIDNGTYGICDSCGEDISIKRLKARPVTTQCIQCKTREEAKEDALGI
jgi:DnaK suppressor protein